MTTKLINTYSELKEMELEDIAKSIKEISDGKLIDSLMEEVKVEMQPHMSIMQILRAKRMKIDHDEYLRNRGVKAYPELLEFNPIIEMDKDNFKEALIDLDEYLRATDIDTEYVSNLRIWDILTKRKVDSIIEDELIKFLVDRNILTNTFTANCKACGKVVATFDTIPNQEKLDSVLFETYICDTCDANVEDIKVEDLIISGFFKIGKVGNI